MRNNVIMFPLDSVHTHIKHEITVLMIRKWPLHQWRSHNTICVSYYNYTSSPEMCSCTAASLSKLNKLTNITMLSSVIWNENENSDYEYNYAVKISNGFSYHYTSLSKNIWIQFSHNITIAGCSNVNLFI